MFGRRKHPAPPAFQPRPAVQPGMAPPAPVQPPGPTMRSAANRLRHRARHGLRPWLVLAALPVLGGAGHAFAHGYAGSAAGFLAAAVAIWRLWPEMAKRPAVRWMATSWCALGAGWLAWVSLAGLGKAALLAMMGLWLPPYLAHWNLHRAHHGYGRTQPAPLPEPDELTERLRARVCGAGAKVAGASVTELPRIPGGRVFRFSLVPGKQTLATVLSATAEIASAAEIPLARVIAESMPGDHPGERGPEHLAKVTILDPHHPQREIQEFAGPTLDMATGLFDVGPYPDGEMARSRLFKVDEHGRAIRAASGIACGTTGSGKSRYAERKIMEHLASGMFQVILLDGQGGASIPALTAHVGWAAYREDEWQRALTAILRLGVARTRLISARGMSCWDLSLGPFVQVFLEEAHKILLDPVSLLAVKFGIQELEKVAIGFDLSTQVPSQVELGSKSGAKVLRDLASSGNVTLHRTGGQFAASVLVGEMEVFPHLLPQIPGMCHPLGYSMRTAPARGIRAADPLEWAHLFSPAPFTPLDIEALDGTEAAWGGRHERLAGHMKDPSVHGLDLGSVEREVAVMLGQVQEDQPPSNAERAEKVKISDHVWEVVTELGPIKREDIIPELKKRGVECHVSSVDQALASFKRNNWLQADKGCWERAPLAAVKEG